MCVKVVNDGFGSQYVEGQFIVQLRGYLTAKEADNITEEKAKEVLESARDFVANVSGLGYIKDAKLLTITKDEKRQNVQRGPNDYSDFEPSY